MKKLWFAIAAALLAWGAQAQTSLFVKGQVLDAAKRQGVPFALVQINQHHTYADEKGYFEIQVKPAEVFHVQASQLGFEASSEEKTADQLQQLVISLAPRTLPLEEITVSSQPMHCHPQSDIICDRAKQATQSRDIGDLFKDIPGFAVVKKGGFAMDPVFRSFKYEQLNIIFDGGIQTTHACPARMDPATTHVNPDLVQKVELIKGPFSVRYGAAMGATVNIVTETWNPAENGFGGYVSGGLETNGRSKLTQFQLQHNSRLDLMLSGAWKDFGSYTSGDGTLIPSSFKAYDYSLKAGYDLAENQRIQINWRQNLSRDVLHAGLAMDTDSDDGYMLSLDYNWRNISPLLYSITAKAYGNHVDHVMSNSRRPNAVMANMVSSVLADSHGGRLEAALTPGKKNLVYAGLDYRYLWRDGTRQRTIKRNMMTGEPLPQPMYFEDAIWQNSHIHDAGAFVEARRFLTPRTTVMVGLRADRVYVRTQDPAPDFKLLYGDLRIAPEWNMSTTASLLYATPTQWQLQWALGRGVRTANMIERFINHFTIGIDPYEYVGNPHLKPEANHQAEFSVSKKAYRYQFSANVFYSYLTHFITAAVDSTLRRKYMGAPPFARRFVNIDKATQAGVELSAQATLAEGLNLYGHLAYTRAQNLSWNEPLPEIPPLEAVLGARYERNRWWADVRGRFVDNQSRISEVFGETATSGFSTLDARAGVEPFKGLALGVAVLNILNRQYREHLNRAYRNMPTQGIVFEPGRNVTLFAKYKF